MNQIKEMEKTRSVDPNLGCCMRFCVKVKWVAKTNRVLDLLDQLDAESRRIEDFIRSLNNLLALAHVSARFDEKFTLSGWL